MIPDRAVKRPALSALGRRLHGAIIVLVLVSSGCADDEVPGNRLMESAVEIDEERARNLVLQYGCDGCHVIPGIASANGRVGPPLDRVAHRSYLAGVIPNTYPNMVQWLYSPPTVDPDTAMPDMGLQRGEAEILAAWLYTLD